MPYALVDEWEELLCWFDFPNAAEPTDHVKTHDCRWNVGNFALLYQKSNL
jgi:hypothetical protein